MALCILLKKSMWTFVSANKTSIRLLCCVM